MALIAVKKEWRKLVKDVEIVSLHPSLWFTPETLPVVGLDVVDVQDIIYALRAADEQATGLADAWLRAVQCAQLAHDRLLRDLRDVDRNLGFWQQQVAGGGAWSHRAFMLLARGPSVFAADVAIAVTRLRRVVNDVVASAKAAAAEAGVHVGALQEQPQLQQRTGEVVPAEGQQAGEAGGPHEGSATDMMQQRVLLLRALRSRLAVALAQLTEAAGRLRLEGLVVQPASASASAGRLAAPWAARGGGVTAAPQQRLQGVEAAVRAAVRAMRAALEALLAPPQAEPGCAEPQAGPGAEAAAAAAAAAAGGGGGGEAAPSSGGSSSLASELAALLELLALQPLAGAALGLPKRSGHQAVLAAAAAGDAAPEVKEEEGAGASGSGVGESAPATSAMSGLHVTAGGASARAALDAARRAAALAGPLLPLPASARMPSAWQRHWLRYLAAGALVGYGGLFLLRHSRLAGSDDLDRWLLSAASSVRSALSTHVVAPLAAVRDELFRTFRDRPAIVSPEEFALTRESLVRMLEDFAADQGKRAGGALPGPNPGSNPSAGAGPAAPAAPAPEGAASPPANGGPASPDGGCGSGDGESGGGSGGGGGSEAAAEAAVAAGMAVLMGCYEEELRRPLRNLVLGDLARALLIQVHHVKVDGQAAMLRLDQLLRANELTAALVAALPALGVTLAAGAGLLRLVTPRAPDPRREAVPARLAMASLELALTQLARREGAAVGAAATGAPAGWRAEAEMEAEALEGQAEAEAEARTEAAELRGLALYRLFQVYGEVCRLYAPASRRSRTSEWRPLHADLLRLAAPRPAAERLAEHQRIMRTYTVFQR